MSDSWLTGTWHTVPGLLDSRLDADPDGLLYEIDRVAMTARDLDEQSRRLASGLSQLGVGQGDRVALLLDNCAPFAVALFAVARLGAIVVPINTANRSRFLQHPLSDCGAKALVVHRDLLSHVEEVRDGLVDLQACVVVGDDSSNGSDNDPALPCIAWDEVRDAAPMAEAPEVRPDATAAVLYTSGTTGRSKGCVISHNYLIGRSERPQWVLGRNEADVVWTPLPMFHINALTFGVIGTLLVGGSAFIARRFSLSAFWSEIERASATIATLMGSIASLIAKHPDHGASRGHLKAMLAVPLTREVERIWREDFGVAPCSGMYGMTEVAPLSIVPPTDVGLPGENKPGAAGRINDLDFEVKVFDVDDRDVATGQVGEIVCRPRRPYRMFDGYWNRPDATVAACRNLWFHTGDLGRIDEEGFLYLVDRKADYIRRRGENVSSKEVEATLIDHPSVEEVAITAVPSELGEDDIKATVVVREDGLEHEAQLRDWAEARLPFFAVPRYIEFREQLPKNAVGRVLKHVLRDEGRTDATWDHQADDSVRDHR